MIYVIFSAFLYILGVLFPALSCVCMTTFLIPLCVSIVNLKGSIRFAYGALWGAIVFTVHWYWMLVLLGSYTVHWSIYVGWISLIAWGCCWSGLWLWMFAYHRLWSSVLFFMFISGYSFFFTGVVEGYPLFSPLISLTWYPSLLGNLYWLSDVGMLTLLFSIQIILVDLWRYKTTSKVYNLAGLILIMVLGCISSPRQKTFDSHSIVTLYPWWYGCGDPMFAGYRMSHDLCETMQNHPGATFIVMPESTFCWDIHEYASFLPIWSQSAGDVSILFGAHETDGSVSHNAAFLLHKNELVFRYRKRHFMPILERSTWLEKLCNQSAIYGSKMLNPVKTSDDDLIVISCRTYQIFICSELFFEAKKPKGYPIMFLWNDAWLQLEWTKRLAVLFINYFEHKYRIPVIFVSTQGRSNIF